MDRRGFLRLAAGGVLAALAGKEAGASGTKAAGGSMQSRVALVKGPDRVAGIRKAIRLLEANPVQGRPVLIKPNFNTADPFPASTHNDTLSTVVGELQRMDAGRITIGERSGPPATARVLADKGIEALAQALGVGVVNFEALGLEDWVRVIPEQSHWRHGFDVARPVLDAEAIVSTCCIKTHAFGGVFTMSLKLSVGVTHKRNMTELHSSPAMRKMIAEINQVYAPALIVMDGMEVFTDGGPARGERKRCDVIVAGTDRIAVDAVGLAVLKDCGANRAIMDTPIFEQEQIARAVELGLGVGHPEDIELVAEGTRSRVYADRLAAILHDERRRLVT